MKSTNRIYAMHQDDILCEKLYIHTILVYKAMFIEVPD